MRSENYLSRLILLTSILISLFAFIVLPIILSDDSNAELKTYTFRNALDENGLSLPTPTKYAVLFSDHNVIRFTIFILFAVAGVLLEIQCKNKKITGTYHLVYLLLGIMICGLFLFACILPSIPL